MEKWELPLLLALEEITEDKEEQIDIDEIKQTMTKFIRIEFKKKPYRTRPIKILYLPVDFQTPNIFQSRKKNAHGSRKFDYLFDIRTQQFFVTVWEIMLVEEKGRIKSVPVTEGAFTQLPREKRFPFCMFPMLIPQSTFPR